MDYSKVKFVTPSVDGDYFTRGKVYAFEFSFHKGGYVTDDDGEKISIFIPESAHLEGNPFIPCHEDGTPLNQLVGEEISLRRFVELLNEEAAKMSELKIWPWDFGDKPYFVNGEGYHWFIDETLTKFYRSRAGGDKLVFFIVAVLKDGKYDPVERVLMDSDTNNVLYSSTRLEDIACHADMVCLHNTL